MEPTEAMLLRPCQLKNLQSTMRGTITTSNTAIRRTGVDTLGPNCYNTHIDTKERAMTDYEILVTAAVVAVIFAVKVWILTKI
jgi:hypothetical protein